jgi:hypothetical protein
MNFSSFVSFLNIWSHSIFTIIFIFVGIITTNILIWHWNSQWIVILSQFWFWIDWISLRWNEVKWNEEIWEMDWPIIGLKNNDVDHPFASELGHLSLNQSFFKIMKFNVIHDLTEILTTLRHRTSTFNPSRTFHRKLVVHMDDLHSHTSLELPVLSHIKDLLVLNQFRARETFHESIRDVWSELNKWFEMKHLSPESNNKNKTGYSMMKISKKR